MTKYTEKARFGKMLKGLGRNCLLLGSAALFALFVSCKTGDDDPQQDQMFAVTYTEKGDGGTVSATYDGKSLKSGGKVLRGTKVTFTATPADGYVAEWPGDAQPEASKNSVTVEIKKTTNVTVKFVPKSYTITYELDGGENNAKNPTAYTSKDLPLTLKEPKKLGYEFIGWYTSEAYTEQVTEIAKGAKGNKTFYAYWKLTGESVVRYTVRHHWQKADSDDYDTEEAYLYGAADSKTAAKAAKQDGFELDREITQQDIAKDGNTVVDIYYKRKIITLSFNSDGGSSVASITGKFGAKVNKPVEPTKENFNFGGWKPELPVTFPAENATYTAEWFDKTHIQYKVEHLLQKIDATGKAADPAQDASYELKDSETVKKFGKAGEKTSAAAKMFEGFTAKPIEQKDIAEGVTVKVYYLRNDVTLTFNGNGGAFADGQKSKTLTGKFGETISQSGIPTPAQAGKIFNNWNPELPETFPMQNKSYRAKWDEGAEVQYTVKHLRQKIDAATGKAADPAQDASYELKESVQEFGKAGASTSAVAKTFDGFTAKRIEPQTIAEGITVKVYYLRNAVTLTFNGNGGAFAGGQKSKTLTGKYGETIAKNAIPTPQLNKNMLTGWNPAQPATFPVKDTTYEAQWKPENGVSYTVRHLGQPVTGDTYEELEKENLTGIAGTEAKAKAKTFEGFHISDTHHPEETHKDGTKVRPLPAAKIKEDGSTVLTVYYERNVYTVTLDLQGGKGITTSVSGRHGAELGVGTPAKDGYTFGGWEPPLPAKYLKNSTHTAKWIEGAKPKYEVEHWKQKILASGKAADADKHNAENYEKHKTQTLEGSVGASTNAEALEELTGRGFKTPIITQKTVSADNSTVVKVYYERVDVKLTLNANGGAFADGKDSKELKGKFGEKIPLPAEPTKAGFQFGGWKDIPATFPKVNAIYTATWSNKPQADYTVKHWKQKIDGTTGKVIGDETNGANYEVSADTQKFKGEVGANTDAKAKTQADAGYEGFTALTVKQQKIVAGGATVIDIYYKRNAVKLTFKGDGGKFDGDKESVEYNGKYGEKLSAYGFTKPTKRKFILKGWKSGSAAAAMVETFPAKNTDYTAEWEKEPLLKYTVNHWTQKLGGNGKVLGAEHNNTNFEKADGEELSGERDAMTNAQAKDVTSGSYKGFVAPMVTQKTIDDNTVIDLYYLRKDVTLTFKGNGGQIKRVLSRDNDGTPTYSEAKDEIVLTGKYGEKLDPNDEVPLPAAADRLNANGDKFAGWNETPKPQFLENTTYSAKWTQLENLEITNPANVTTYFVGEKTFDRTGLQVKAVYKDNSRTIVTDQCTDNLKDISDTKGKKDVTLTYRGHTVKFQVEIKENTPTVFEVGDIIDGRVPNAKHKVDTFVAPTNPAELVNYYVIVKVDASDYHAVRLLADGNGEVRMKTGINTVYGGSLGNDNPLDKAQMQAVWAAKAKFFAACTKIGLTINDPDIQNLKKSCCFYKVGPDWKFMKDNGSEGDDWELGASVKVIPLVVRKFTK